MQSDIKMSLVQYIAVKPHGISHGKEREKFWQRHSSKFKNRKTPRMAQADGVWKYIILTECLEFFSPQGEQLITAVGCLAVNPVSLAREGIERYLRDERSALVMVALGWGEAWVTHSR